MSTGSIRKAKLGRFTLVWLLIAGLLFVSNGIFATAVYAEDTQTQITQFEPDVEIIGNATYTVRSNSIAAQTFTVTLSHDISYISIYGYITGDPSYVQVQLRTANGTVVATSVPTKNLVYHWFSSKSETSMSSACFTGNETGSWVMCELGHAAKLDPGLYSVVVRAPAGDPANYFNWYYNDGGDPYAGGRAWTSDDDGGTWDEASVDSDDDFMFETWGESGLIMQSVNVYNSFYEDDDWLLVVSYINKAPTYYKSDDIEQYFRLRLTENVTGNVTGETVLRSWDASVASIYLNADEASWLEWETGNFTLDIVATYGDGFLIEHTLVPADFIGDTLNFLDRWCIAQAQWMGTINHGDDMYYLRDTSIGLVMNEKGISKFDLGIPRLGAIRGEHIYESYIDEAILNNLGEPDPQLQSKFVWNTQLGVTLSGILDNLASPFNMSGKILGLIIVIVLYVAVVGVSFPTGHQLAGTSAGFIIILMGMIAGVVDVTWIVLAGIAVLAMGLRQLILVGQ